MKLLPMLLLNLATVGVALVIYDQVRTEPARTSVVAGIAGADNAALAERLSRIEAAQTPQLQASGTNPRGTFWVLRRPRA